MIYKPTLFHKAQILTGLVLILISLSPAALAYNDDVDKVVMAEMQRQKIPGAAVAVIQNGKVLKQKGYGVANVELNAPVTGETAFKIGSISKPIIATGVMRLVEEGKIGLDDPIGKYFKDAPVTWKDVTIRHFLSHTSGIIREAPGYDPFKIQPDYDVIATAFALPTRFAVGEKYEYCNVGFFSLAEIITRTAGKPWGQYLEEIMFRPLKMTSTRVTSNGDIIPNRADAYRLSDGKLTNEESYRSIRPSGAFYSTLKDMVAWSLALETGVPVKRETLAKMWTPFKLNDGTEAPYGLGWQIGAVRGKKRIGHGGSLSGFRSNLAIFPEDKLTVIVLLNLASGDPQVITGAVADVYIDFPRAASPAQ